ncbi:hypothetical protein PG985_003678 [Apiospora marii]|uniref:F-box domain-containing protein n=1 Tax=Apiospora marii TaxID=335849 RepID=A0ABR1SHE7_9PEZI
MLQLPTELVLEIVTRVASASDLLHFALTCRGLSALFLDELYRRDVRIWNCSALLWACRTGSVATARRSLDAGAAVNHLFFNQAESAWPPWGPSRDAARASCLAGHPLAIAVQHRHLALVRFLLEERGADPNRDDTWAVAHHGESWFPIHWAVSCQTPLATQGHGHDGDNGGGNSNETGEDEEEKQLQKQCCGFPANGIPPPDPEIVSLLLRHGADPNEETIGAPDRSTRYFSESHQDRLRPLHLTGCDHVPLAILRLLLEAGADHRAPSACWGCHPPPRHGRGYWCPALFEYFRPLWPFQSEAREAKLQLAARHGGEDRRRWRFDRAATASTLHVLTPSRLKTLLFLTGNKENEPVVLASGVFPMLDAWSRQKAAALVAAEKDPKSEDAARQAERLGLLENLIARLVGVSRMEYTDEAVLIDRTESQQSKSSTPAAGATNQVTGGLASAFRSFCATSKNSNDASPFLAVLAEHGIRPQREGRQLTLSETIERGLAPKTRCPPNMSLCKAPWLGDLVTRYQGDYGLYRRDVDSDGKVGFHWIGEDEEARREAERRMEEGGR